MFFCIRSVIIIAFCLLYIAGWLTEDCKLVVRLQMQNTPGIVGHSCDRPIKRMINRDVLISIS